MSYTKRDLAAFSEKLSNGGYPGGGGARRAIGKFKWSKSDKAEAHALVDKHFGASGTQSKVPVKSVKEKEEKEAKPAKRRGRPPGKKSAEIAESAHAKDTSNFSQGYGPKPITNENVAAHALRAPVTEGIREPAFTALYSAHSAIISAFRTVSPLTPHEQELLERATAEAAAMCVTPEGQAFRDAQWGDDKEAVKPAVKRTPANAVARPHIAIPPVVVEQAPTASPPIVEASNPLEPSQQERLAVLQSSVRSLPNFGPKIPPLDVNGG